MPSSNNGTRLADRLSAAEAELGQVQALVIRSQQAFNEAQVQQIRLAERVMLLRDLIAESSHEPEA